MPIIYQYNPKDFIKHTYMSNGMCVLCMNVCVCVILCMCMDVCEQCVCQFLCVCFESYLVIGLIVKH